VCVAEHRSVFTNFHTKPLTAGADVAASESGEADPFVVDSARLLFTFFSVVVIDVMVISLMTHRLRFWFPQWLDPQWATRRDPWVVYSQSYFAGIFMIPILCRLVDHHFLATAGAAWRAAFWSLCLIVFARQTGILPECVRGLTRRQMLRGLLFGVSLFFLVMSIMDPVVQLGVQHLPWSAGLSIEVGFFIPTGIILMILSRRLRA